jgi:hypothetical protein
VGHQEDGLLRRIHARQNGDEIAVLRAIWLRVDKDMEVAFRIAGGEQAGLHRFRGLGARADGKRRVDLDQFLEERAELRLACGCAGRVGWAGVEAGAEAQADAARRLAAARRRRRMNRPLIRSGRIRPCGGSCAKGEALTLLTARALIPLLGRDAMKSIVLACALACVTPAAFAQDAICGGLDVLFLDAAKAAPFRSFEIDDRTGKELPDVARPAGLESAYECRVKHGDTRDMYECTWSIDASTVAPGAISMIDRVASCLTPKGWSSAPLADPEGLVTRRFTPASGKLEVVILSTPPGGAIEQHVLSVRANR